MASLDRVRAEIKAWERDFAARHGRDPSVQDIRDQPSIADKYKLYKKLAKPTLPKPRPADPAPPLPGFNPFSPTKKSLSTSRANPFATPTKSNLKSHPPALTPSPDPPQPNASESSHVLPVPTSAVSRARKRLRGEPVSPSPNKPKRQRTRPQALPPFSMPEQDSSSSEGDADQELPLCDFTSSYVADSPVKAPAGGKSFKLLFDDALPALTIPKKPLGLSLAQPGSPDARFPCASADPPATTSRKRHHDLTSKGVISGSEHRNRAGNNMFPTRDHPPASLHGSIFATAAPQPRTSVKRALESGNPTDEQTELDTPLQARYLLVPPSPPPQDSINRGIGKGKAKTLASRKKSRVEDEESDNGVDSSDDISLKVATVSLTRDKRSHQHADDLDWDPLLHLGARNHDPAAKQQIDANHHASGTFSVNLPDKFRRVLAISPSRSLGNMEERVVRGLLYGDRVGHYDPSRGGDIWDAGETDDAANGDVEAEDDWEGEPVPWEVGEL